MYSYDGRIRFSEADKDGYLRLEGLLDYFQDGSTFQSEDLGIGTKYLGELHMVWVLSSWQIVAERYPHLGERVRIETIPYEIKGCFGYRNFAMYDEKEERIAYANSLWTLLDTMNMKPAKPTPLMLEKYVLGEKLPMDYAPRKIALPKGLKRQEEIVVKKYHLDSNNHVNNGQYVRMGMDFLPDTKVKQMRAEYKKQAHLGDVIVPMIGVEENRYTVSLQEESGDIFANVEFILQ